MDKEFLEYQIDNFDKLCHKAKEIIFEGLVNKNDSLISFIEKIGIIDLSEKSPIEQILFFALVIYKIKYHIGISIMIQKEITCNNKTYKVDFSIEGISLENGESHELNHKVIIECDGYEYHSSKEQMQYDYERENNLKLVGYDIIRFTGSQIYNNPFECAKTVYDYAQSKIDNKEYKEDD